MIPIQEQNDVEVSGNLESSTFSIKTTAAAFQLLSSGLYSNKVRAVIRELACNAHDAHVMVNNENPIEIKLPNDLDKQFYVKDFGPGLSHEQVMRLYTTYFDSTKQDSNDFIGGFGVGSKSPFAYTDSFTVEARQDGKSRTYSAYVDEKQVPQIVYMGEVETTEPNGLTVGFPVKPVDFRKFESEALSVGQWFHVKPILKGTVATIPDLDITELSETIAFPKERSGQSAMVRIGNVAYPIKHGILNQDEEGSTDELAEWLISRRIILTMPIGTVSVAASREELSYDKATIKALKQTINDAAKVASKEVVSKLKEFDLTKREQRIKAYEFLDNFSLTRLEFNQNTIDNAIASKTTKRLPLLNRFLLEQGESVDFLKNVVISQDLTSTKNLNLGRGRTSRVGDIDMHDYNPSGYNYTITVSPSQEVVLIEKDLHKSSPLAARAWRNAYSKHVSSSSYSSRRHSYYNKDLVVILDKPNGVDLIKYEEDKKKLLTRLGLEDTLKLSEYLSDNDKKKLINNTTKASVNAKSMLSGRMITAADGQNLYWICGDSDKLRKDVAKNDVIAGFLLNKSNDELKTITKILNIPDSAKLIVVTEDDIDAVSQFKNSKNLVEYISTYLSSPEFKDKLNALPEAKGHVQGPLAYLINCNNKILKVLDETKLGQAINKFTSLEAYDNENFEDLYKGLGLLHNLNAQTGNHFTLPVKVLEIGEINNNLEKNYPMLNAYLSQMRWRDSLAEDHVLYYVKYCEDKMPKPVLQQQDVLDLEQDNNLSI